MSPGKLFRRTIGAAIKRETGWDVFTHVKGTIDVHPPDSDRVTTDFRDEVVRLVRELGYEPTIIARRNEKGRPCVRFHTPETLDQAGMGGHGYKPK